MNYLSKTPYSYNFTKFFQESVCFLMFKMTNFQDCSLSMAGFFSNSEEANDAINKYSSTYPNGFSHDLIFKTKLITVLSH